jgi:hypothetical protein
MTDKAVVIDLVLKSVAVIIALANSVAGNNNHDDEKTASVVRACIQESWDKNEEKGSPFLAFGCYRSDVEFVTNLNDRRNCGKLIINGWGYNVYGFPSPGYFFKKTDARGYNIWCFQGHIIRHDDRTMLVYSTHHGRGCNYIDQGDSLRESEFVCTVDGSRYIIMQRDGNVVVYKNGKPTWASGTDGQQSQKHPFRLTMQEDGNLVLYNRDNYPFWASHTKDKGVKGGYWLIATNDMCKIIDKVGNILW